MQQPFLAEEADVQIDAIECAEQADRVGAVLEHVHGPRGRLGLGEVVEQRSAADEVVELLVVELAAGQLLAADALGHAEARHE